MFAIMSSIVVGIVLVAAVGAAFEFFIDSVLEVRDALRDLGNTFKDTARGREL